MFYAFGSIADIYRFFCLYFKIIFLKCLKHIHTYIILWIKKRYLIIIEISFFYSVHSGTSFLMKIIIMKVSIKYTVIK